jgi:hypothetical protein
VSQVNLYHKQASLPLLWILHYPKANILVIKRFILLYSLLKLVKLSSVTNLFYYLSKFVNLSNLAIIYILCYINFSLVRIVTAVVVSAYIRIFVSSVVVIVEKVIVIILRTIASVAVIIVIFFVAS